MFRLFVLSTLAVLAAGQHYNRDPKTAAIISEQRYLSGDGKFGAAYTQEDGINFKEETEADGTRRGSYSYIDPSGQKRTISYTAGKNGFQATGDHLPVAPPAPPHAVNTPAPIPQYQAGYNPANQAPTSFGRSNDYDDGQYDPRYNDPSFSGNQSPSRPATNYNAQPAYNPAPVVPQYQPPQPQYQPQQQYQPQPSYNHVPQYTTTPNPHRFQPPGKLSLNRTPDGFSYSFAKQ